MRDANVTWILGILGNLTEEAFGFLEEALPDGSGEVDILFGV